MRRSESRWFPLKLSAQSYGEASSERACGFERAPRVGGSSAAVDVADDALLVHHKRHALRHTEETQHTIEL